MAEAEEQEGTPSLAEQWALDNDENKGNGENPEEKVEDVDPKEASKEVDSKETESTDDVAVPAAVDVAPLEDAGSEEVNETPETTEAEETAETAEEEEASAEAPAVKIETAPADFRFPTTNQTRHCFTRYVEYHRCINAMGEGAPECDKFAKYYRSLCPSEWVERWNEQRENGTFPGPL